MNADVLSRYTCDARIHNQCENNTTVNIYLDTPIPTHKVLVLLNRTPVPSQLTLEDTGDIDRIENAFLETGTKGAEGGVELIKVLSAHISKVGLTNPISVTRSMRPLTNTVVTRTSTRHRGQQSLGREAIPGKCQ